MITLVFQDMREMISELAAIGFVRSSDLPIVITPVCNSPIQTAEEQAAALDAVFAKSDAAREQTSLNATTVPEVKETSGNDNSGQTVEVATKVTEVSETKPVDEKPPVVDETTKIKDEPPKPMDADTVRDACVRAARRVPAAQVYEKMVEKFGTKTLAEIPVEKLGEVYKTVEALGMDAKVAA